MRRASSLSACRSAADPCEIVRDRFGASSCARCTDTWSATHSGGFVLVARARAPVGVDAELSRSRPAAFRFLTRVTGASIVTIEQWTQAEAIWKAAGQAHRRPLAGELVLPDAYANGWNATTDAAWNVYTRREPGLVWSVAVPNDGACELEVRDHRADFADS
jgi:phosphopantetheinyl transferase